MPTTNYFKLRKRAETDLIEIYQYSLNNWGIQKADRYIRELNTTFELLVDNPDLGLGYDHIRDNLRGYRTMSHIIFYRIAGAGISVVRILHISMDYTRHISA